MSYEKVSNAKNVVVGKKQTLQALKKGIINEVVVAEDADYHLVHNVAEFASQLNIPVSKVDSMKQLGKACGIQVGASAVGIVS
ncbi:50S ribosomal protein L7ae-like protein [Bacillus sp. 165]|uniref:50S ribosomal protein L7ae-like protein n=1 Tax=Bacillus sp. 165 TaxID=1529117 RepID=UPI001ADAFF99|nr:50S ribosomal protein L7ae-like protein [Bacillus sp. 165]